MATYAKISLGFFQVAAILVLNLQVRQKYVGKMDQITLYIYTGMSIWVGLLILSVIIFMIVLSNCP